MLNSLMCAWLASINTDRVQMFRGKMYRHYFPMYSVAFLEPLQVGFCVCKTSEITEAGVLQVRYASCQPSDNIKALICCWVDN